MATDNINDTGTNTPIVTTTQSQSTYPQVTGYIEPVYKDTPSDPGYTALVLAQDKLAAARQNLKNVLKEQSNSGNYDEVARKAAQAQLDAADAEVVKKANAWDTNYESVDASKEGTTAASAGTNGVAPKAPSKPGNKTNDDSSINNTKSGTNASLKAGTQPSGIVTPKPNILDQFSSYTYGLSLYVLTPEQYKLMSATKQINTNQWSLLMQTGGAAPPVTPAAPAPAAPTPPATQTKPVTASYRPDGTVIDPAYNDAGF